MRLLRDLHDERGGVLVMVAVWIPLLILLTTFVVDVGNWFVHKRHLQVQADAGALAGGGSFNSCLSNPGSTTNTAIENMVRLYAGSYAGAYNEQIGGANKGTVTTRINRKTYEVGGPGPDDTTELPPCDAKMIDVKMTEASLPWFFGFVSGDDKCGVPIVADKCVVPAINARARVNINQITTRAGSLPMAVPDPRPKAAAALFVEEDAQTILPGGRVVLTAAGTTTLNGQVVTQWDNAAAPATVTAGARKNGVVIALSGNKNWSLSGSLSTICAQPLVNCYHPESANPPQNWFGLWFLEGYSTSGTGSAANPILRDVHLSPPSCNFSLGSCTASVKAKIDFGVAGNPSASPTSAVVKTSPGEYGCPSSGAAPKGCALAYNATGPDAGYWTSPSLTFPADSGPLAVTLNWKTSSSSAQTFGTVQRAYTASSTGSGPIKYVSVSQDTLQYGANPGVVVTIGVAGSLKNATKVSDPTVILRLASTAGSRNQTLDCDAGVNLHDEIVNGCKTQYTINADQACPNTSVPLNCVPVETGDKTGPLRDGMNDRFVVGGVCTPNNWTAADPNALPEFTPGDPRIVPLILTAFASFTDSGSGSVPVIDFATFYVTGWDSALPACDGVNEPSPNGTSQKGDVWGHFIKYVDQINSGGGTQTCDYNAIGGCVVVLTN